MHSTLVTLTKLLNSTDSIRTQVPRGCSRLARGQKAVASTYHTHGHDYILGNRRQHSVFYHVDKVQVSIG